MSDKEQTNHSSSDDQGRWHKRKRPHRAAINTTGAKRVVKSFATSLVSLLGKTLDSQTNALRAVSQDAREFIAGATDRDDDRRYTTVRGYGIGPHTLQDQTLVARVYVTEKRALSKLPPAQRVPRKMGKLRTDVIPIGETKPIGRRSPGSGSGGSIYPFAGSDGDPLPFAGSGGSIFPFAESVRTDIVRELYARRCKPARPVVGGTSIAPSGKDWSGTLGAIVKRKSSGNAFFGLTNNHVAANIYQMETNPSASRDAVKIGHPIDQPASMDDLEKNPLGGRIGKLIDVAPLRANIQNFDKHQVDAALIDFSTKADQEIYNGWKPAGTMTASYYQTVIKCGRTTGVTLGLVFDLYASFWLNYGYDASGNPIDCWFNDQIAVIGHAMNPAFSDGGDSGSLVFDYQTKKAVGLLFAGSDSGLTFMNPIKHVINQLSSGGRIII